MAAWRKGNRPSLETEAWKALEVSQGQSKRKYLVKGLFSDDGYQVMISDTSSIWQESIHSDTILERLKVSKCGGHVLGSKLLKAYHPRILITLAVLQIFFFLTLYLNCLLFSGFEPSSGGTSLSVALNIGLTSGVSKRVCRVYCVCSRWTYG